MPSPDVSWEMSGDGLRRRYRLLLDGVPQFVEVFRRGHHATLCPWFIAAAGVMVTDGNGNGFRTETEAQAKAAALFGKGGAA